MDMRMCSQVVWYAKVPQGGILLDLVSGEYLGLVPISATIWEYLLEGLTLDEVRTHLIENKEEAQQAEVESSLQAIQDRFTQESYRQLPTHFIRVLCPILSGRWIQLEILTLLCVVHVWLQRPGGIARLLASIHSLPAQIQIQPYDRQLRSLTGVLRAIARFQRDAYCLHQSLALSWLLRRRGIDAKVIFGAYTGPFSPHAWVECAGKTIFWPGGNYADPLTTQGEMAIFHAMVQSKEVV